MSESPIQDLLQALRAALEERAAAPRDRAAALRRAVDQYAAAVEGELAARAARNNGLSLQPTMSPREAAMALRDLVDSLPEFRGLGSEEHNADSMSPSMHPSSVGHSNSFVYEATDEAIELLQEVKTLDFDTMSIAMFRVYGSELAARARSLQVRKLEAENIPSRVIRKLTAVAHAKGVTSVKGLARWHQEDWDEAARRHRATRERLMEEAEPSELNSAETMPPRRGTISEYPSIMVSEERDAEEEETAVVRQSLPRLLALARERKISLVGGACKSEKLKRVQERFAIEFEWIETARSGMNSIISLENRMRAGRVGALVVLEALMKHEHVESLIEAARHENVPFAYGDRAGIGALSRALSQLEAQLVNDSVEEARRM